jgi:hypothetical protein
MSSEKPLANQRPAIAELSLMLLTRTLPPSLEGARIEPQGTVIHDLNGKPLFRRLALTGAGVSGYADVAIAPELGAPLVAVSHGQAWDEHGLLAEGKRVAANRFKVADAAQVQFVAYSFPKIALRFLDRDNRELLLLELWTWEQVPERRETKEPPGNFERWSYLDETPREVLRAKAENHDRRQAALGRLAERVQSFTLLDRISSSELEVVLALPPGSLFGDSRDLHYGTHTADHVPCYELHGQETSVWCVAASVQMLLDFYRYEYTQVRLAQEMGLGTLANPSPLPFGQEHKGRRHSPETHRQRPDRQPEHLSELGGVPQRDPGQPPAHQLHPWPFPHRGGLHRVGYSQYHRGADALPWPAGLRPMAAQHGRHHPV